MSELALKLIAENKKTKNPKLDLGLCGLTAIPEEVLELTWLEELILSNKWYEWRNGILNRNESSNRGEENRLSMGIDLEPLVKLKKLIIAGEYTSKGKIKSLDFIKNNRNLEFLLFSDNQMSDISSVAGLKNLSVLNFPRNHVSDISPVAGLKNLSVLYFTNNQVSDISPIAGLNNLSELNFSDNHVNDISTISGLKNLSTLDFSYNQVRDIFPIAGLKNLTTLNFSGNQISDISSIAGLKNLSTLDFSGNFVSDISPVKGLINLKNLYFSSVEVNDISSISGLKNLTNLSFSDNDVIDISPVGGLKNLSKLSFYFNQASDISHVRSLINLTRLDFSFNQVSDITPLGRLKELTNLDLSNNQVSDITPLGRLKELTNLDLSNNQVSDISSIHELINLSDQLIHLEIGGNPLQPEILKAAESGIVGLRQYIIESLRTNTEELIAQLPQYENKEIKLILVGNSTAGKSTLAHYLQNNQIKKHGINSTAWLDKITWKTDHATIHIYDFGGQEYYHETHHLFFTRDTAYILLWDHDGNRLSIRDTKVIKDGIEVNLPIQHYPVEYWLDAIDHYTSPIGISEEKVLDGPNEEFNPTNEHKLKSNKDKSRQVDASLGELFQDTYPQSKTSSAKEIDVLLVQNKIELNGVRPINLSELQEEFVFIKESLAISLHEKKRLSSLHEALDEIIQKIKLKRNKRSYTYQIVKEAIENISFESSNQKSILTIQEFTDWSNERLTANSELKSAFGIKGKSKLTLIKLGKLKFEPKEAVSMAYLFSTSGSVFYFPYNEKLKNLVYLNPQGIIKDIHHVLAFAEKDNGEFKLDMAKLAASISKLSVEELLALMGEFKIVFKHPVAPNTWIAPLYLPENPAKGIELFLNQLKKPIIRFSFKRYIHKSIILEIFNKYGSYAFADQNSGNSEPYYWRSGLVVGDKNQLVVIRFFKGQETRNEFGRIDPDTFEPSRIDIFQAVGDPDSAMTKNIIREIYRICQGWKFEIHVTTNGEEFFSIKDLKEHQKNQEYIIYKNKREFKLRDFHHYLKELPPLHRVFISYSSEDSAIMKRLVVHLDPLRTKGDIETWYDHEIKPGEDWNEAIHKQMQKADVFILLISADFIASSYVLKHEIPFALDMFEKRQAIIFPILVSDCQWQEVIPNLQQIKTPTKSGNQKPEVFVLDKSDSEKSLNVAVNNLKEVLSKFRPIRK